MDFIIFKFLKDSQAVKTGLLSAGIILSVYVGFSVLLSVLSLRPFPEGSLIDIILFGGLRAFSGFRPIDWVILGLFPIFGGILFANYSFWKCKTSGTAKTGLFAGLLAATCPACILPVIGASSVLTFVTKISIYIKIGALALIIGATYVVVRKQGNNCKTN